MTEEKLLWTKSLQLYSKKKSYMYLAPLSSPEALPGNKRKKKRKINKIVLVQCILVHLLQNPFLFSRYHSRLNHLLYKLRMFQIASNSFKLILISSFLFKHLEPYNIDMCITTVLTMWSPKSTYKFSALSGIRF